ncbi:ABC transporter permease [Haladaptatus sp. DYF46]|uniref:ABC transporter permease n=1 Tax=Haladaptatus sp. DYF46 TaxID=2886041 RepID=UPI001E62CD52|nr:ABC transporter permease [Haladaptatus sp. DYF46]
MGYQRGLCTQWSRRDRLTIVIIAVATAFLVGTTILLVAVNTQTSAISSGFNDSMTVTHYDSLDGANAAAANGDIVLPTAAVRQNGATRYVIGVPKGAPRVLEDISVAWREARFPQPPPDGTLAGPVDERTRQRFAGTERTKTVAVSPASAEKSVFPQSWYVGDPATVRSLGTTGAYVVDTTPKGGGNGVQTAVRGVVTPGLYSYFIAGMGDVVNLLGLATVGGGVLVLVVVYNVTRMSVRDRLDAIKVIRATGGTPRSLLALFGARAGLLTGVGIALGYAVGIILTRAVVNGAVAAGLRISLSPSVTPAVLRVLLPGFACLLFAGVGAGVLAVRPATTTPPSRLGRSYRRNGKSTGTRRSTVSGRIPSVVEPTVLRWRTVVPAATILTIFVLIVLLVGSLVGVLAPLATTSGGTITEPGAPYPMASRVDAGYADLLRQQGVKASPEIIAVQLRDGQPYLARGANWSSFAAVSDASLVRGRAPRNKYEAVIGRDLARTLNVGVGDNLTLGGASSPAFTRVTISGVYAAEGIGDDQLVVPLPTAHDLSTNPGTVHFIRTSGGGARLSQSESNSQDVVVSSVSAPDAVVNGTRMTVRVSVRNVRSSERKRQLTASLGSDSTSRTVTLSGGERRTVTMNVSASSLGNKTLRVESYTQSVEVYRHAPLAVPKLPSQAPPGATMAVPVRTEDGANVSGATVRVGSRTARTNEDGVAVVPMPDEEGTYDLTVRKGNRTNTSTVHVASGASRALIGSVRVSPDSVSIGSRPTTKLVVFNPWHVPITRTVSLVTPTGTVEKTVSLGPYETAVTTTEVGGAEESDSGKSSDRLATGTYSVRLVSGGRTIATDSFTVHGDDRTFSTLAQNTDYASGSGLGQAIRGVFGNFNLLLLVMVVLAGLTAVGGTTATFAQAVHARRRAVGVYRATGATRAQLVRLLLADACRLSIPAIVLALAAALAAIRLLAVTGLFTVFGIRLSTRLPLPILLLAVGSALVLMGLSVLIAALPYLVAEPTAVQRGTTNRPKPREERDGPYPERPAGHAPRGTAKD